MGLDNTWWKLRATVEDLATGTGSLQDRLFNVYLSHLAPLDLGLHEADFPSGLSPTMAAIHERMNSVPAVGTEGTTRATVGRMDDTEAAELAKLIVQLFFEVQAAREELGDVRFPRR